MANLQEVFNRIQEKKKEQKEIKKVYRDALTNTPGYQNLVDDIKTMKEKKKTVEENVQSNMGSSLEKLESLKYDIETDQEMMSDLALNKITKGEKIEIKDQYENEYEPLFTVRFRKLG